MFKYGYFSKGDPCNPSIIHIFCKLFVKQEVLALILLECQTFFSWKMSLSFHLSCSTSLSEAREKLCWVQALCCNCTLVIGISLRTPGRACAPPLQGVRHPSTAWAQSSWWTEGIVTQGASDPWTYFKDYLLGWLSFLVVLPSMLAILSVFWLRRNL